MMFVIKFSLLFFLHSVLVECDESEVYHVRLLSPLGDKNILKKSYNIAGTHTFDLFVDPNSNEEPVQRADIAIGKSVVIRCKLADEDTHLEPNLLWFYNGDYIALANDSNKQIETSADQISSNLTIKDVGPSDGGSYECSAANRRKIRKSSKIRFEVIYIFNITELENSEESWCGPKYDNFCKNRGICLYHRTTKILSCKCQPNYFGSYCQNEYISKDVHLKGYSCQQIEKHYTTKFIVILCVCLFSMVTLSISLLSFTKRRINKQKKNFLRRLDSMKARENFPSGNRNLVKKLHLRQRECSPLQDTCRDGDDL